MAYIRHLVDIRFMVRKRPNFEMIEFHFTQALETPRTFVTDVNEFLGGNLNTDEMISVVDPELYRNRKADMAKASGSS